MIKHLISPSKDIDCMNPTSLGRVFEGMQEGFAPCTPMAVMELLGYYKIPLIGTNVVIINSSSVVGRPLAMLLLDQKATVTICHSKTRQLPEISKKGDIVVTAVGRPKHFGEDYFNEASVVIDVGINECEEGKICGDVDYDKVAAKVKGITPVPGGVGAVTTAILVRHAVLACKNQLSTSIIPAPALYADIRQ
jgi:methylenetetrahydrofolate dehydrogenase (NADP+)/methenyltetrahydrofolate cyclohydrolase